MNKGYEGKTTEYAKGGDVLGRTRNFMKEPDRFRCSGTGRFSAEPEPTEDVFGKGMKMNAPAAPEPKDKSLTPVKPKG